MCEKKSIELIKHLNEEKPEICSDFADKLFQVMKIRSQKKCFLTSITSSNLTLNYEVNNLMIFVLLHKVQPNMHNTQDWYLNL